MLFLNQMVARAASSHQISFLDLTSVFARDYQKNKRQFNSPYDSHWNEYGHKITADTLYRFIARRRYLANNKSAGN